ncbi:cytochrome (ubi)quinol oxidase subunit III [Paenibacillus sp. FSL W7-1287]|uniref:cytochrome (ubi)quinol oxidase subunit III n=1 Tax=Paenibacillus sp. FSL W7-1287 TaxID=2954538 RepID=UPI0030F7DDC8
MSSHSHVEGQLPHEPERATLEGRNKITGFWLFLGGETVLFGTLFAAYLTLRGQIMDGPAPNELFDFALVAVATALLLTSSLTSVFSMQAMHRHDVKGLIGWLLVTLVLGAAFLGVEIYEFNHYAHMGHTFSASAFSTSFYTLVGFHGAHVAFGLFWVILLLLQLKQRGLNTTTAPKVYLFSLYWHFIDVVWVFIFTVVYLMGKVG